MRKYVTDMSNNELRKVFDASNEIRDRLGERATEDAYFWTEEALNYFRHNGRTYLDYSIGDYGSNYITVRHEDYAQFLDDVVELNKAMGIVYPHDDVDRALALIERYEDARYGTLDLSVKNYQRLETRIDELIEAITDKMLDYFTADYESAWNDDYLFDLFCDFPDEFSDYYVDESGNLYQEHEDELIASNVIEIKDAIKNVIAETGAAIKNGIESVTHENLETVTA